MRILDLFCGGGAAAWGYHQAGWEVVGVDIRPQPLYPFPFVQRDALKYLYQEVIQGEEQYDAIHASPPCQGYSAHTVSDGRWDRTRGVNEPRLIAEVRELLVRMGLPYVIENVMGARDELRSPVLLCGTMFGLPIPRHRLIEGSFLVPVEVPEHPDCRGVAKAYAEAKGWEYRDMTVTGKGRRAGTSERWSEIMGITFPMTQHNLREAIPPAYGEWAGRQLARTVRFRTGRVLSL